MPSKRVNQSQAVDLIGRRESFIAGELKAESYPEGTAYELDKGWGDWGPPAGSTYVVWSFWTPIAWVDKDGVAWRTPQHFSSRSSAHQSKLYKLSDSPKVGKRAKARRDKAVEAYYAARLEAAKQSKRDAARRSREQAKEKKLLAVQLAAEQVAHAREVDDALASITDSARRVALVEAGS